METDWLPGISIFNKLSTKSTIITRIIVATLVFLSLPGQVFASTFTISANKSVLTNDSFLEVTASISGLKSESTYFLQSGFTRNGENPRYFGFTKNSSGNWYPYQTAPSSQELESSFFRLQTDRAGNFLGRVEVKPDFSDPDYKGPGDYQLKLKRFTSGGSGYWSDNTLFVSLQTQIIPSPVPMSKPSSTPKPTTTPKPAASLVTSKTPSATAKTNNQTLPTNRPSLTLELPLRSLTPTNNPIKDSEGTVAGTENRVAPNQELFFESKQTKTLAMKNKKIAVIFAILGCFLLSLSAFLLYKRRHNVSN